MDYYDLVLGSIPGSFLGVTGTLSVFGIGWTTAIAIAALLALAVIGHALFVRSPVGRRRATSEESTHTTPQPSAAQSAD